MAEMYFQLEKSPSRPASRERGLQFSVPNFGFQSETQKTHQVVFLFFFFFCGVQRDKDLSGCVSFWRAPEKWGGSRDMKGTSSLFAWEMAGGRCEHVPNWENRFVTTLPDKGMC